LAFAAHQIELEEAASAGKEKEPTATASQGERLIYNYSKRLLLMYIKIGHREVDDALDTARR
jgi:hypothetical protein